MKSYLQWASTASKWWSGYVYILYNDDNSYAVSMFFLYLGNPEDCEDINSLEKGMEAVRNFRVSHET